MEEEDYNESDDLLYSQVYGIRKLYFKGSWNEILLGVILDETPESFLIAMPVLLETKDEGFLLKSIPGLQEEPYIRFLKSEFRAVSFAEGIQEGMYVKYLELKSPDIFDNLLELIGLEDSGSENETAMEVKELHEEHTRVENHTGTVVNNGFTNEQIDAKITEAFKWGSFVPSNGKVPN
jgi:hypothetical protein